MCYGFVNLQVIYEIGAVYFVSTNINVTDGLFNRATGKLQTIEFGKNTRENSQVPMIGWIHLTNDLCGADARSKFEEHERIQDSEHLKWVPIFHQHKSLTRARNYRAAANRMTIAKSQGSSLPLVVISTKRKLTRENLYVACSRAASLQELYISGEFTPPSCPGQHDDVSKEMAILRQHPVNMSLRFFLNMHSANKLYFHNVEGFLSHQQDVIAAQNVFAYHCFR